MAYTVIEIIQIAKVSQYLAADDQSKGYLLRGGYERPNLSRLIYLVRSSVEWLNSYNSSNSTLLGKANYLFSLCQPFIGRALQIIGSGGSGTIINPTNGIISTILSRIVEFRIDDPGALMNNGDTSLTLNYPFILNSSVSVIVDGTPMPISQSDRLSFVPIYNPLNVVLNFNQAAISGQVYVIMFLQYISI